MQNIDNEEVETVMKCLVLGDSKVGKSSLIIQFVKGKISEIPKETLSATFTEKRVYVSNFQKELHYHIWELPGSHSYDSISQNYMKGNHLEGASACILVCSATNMNSIKNLEQWKIQVEKICGKIPMIIAVNKIDETTNKISSEELNNIVSKLGLVLFKTSAKTGTNIKELFISMAEQFYLSNIK